MISKLIKLMRPYYHLVDYAKGNSRFKPSIFSSLVTVALLLSYSVSIVSCGSEKGELTDSSNVAGRSAQSSDAKASPGSGEGVEFGEREDHKSRQVISSPRFADFLSSYLESVKIIMAEYYLYNFNQSDEILSFEVIREAFLPYSSLVYESLLSAKMLELEFLAEASASKSLSEEQKARIETILWELYYGTGECYSELRNICFLVIN